VHKKEIIDLSKYRIEKARDMMNAALRDVTDNDYASANNRAYYCIFHAMRAVLAMDQKDYSKHSGVIAEFMKSYLKTNILPREYGTLISNASLIRNRSDYQDFYVCSEEDTKKLINGAEAFLKDVGDYLEKQYIQSEDKEQ